jgi:MFS family permease
MLWGAVLGVVLAVIGLIGQQVIPRWWSHRIGDQVRQSQASGIGIGLFYGTVFTLLPLLALRLMLIRHRHWKFRLSMLGVAILLALPNLFTLGIVLGNLNGAKAGEQTFNVEAPNFRAWSLVGAILAAAIFLGITYLLFVRRRGKRREAILRGQLRAHEAKDAEPPSRP